MLAAGKVTFLYAKRVAQTTTKDLKTYVMLAHVLWTPPGYRG